MRRGWLVAMLALLPGVACLAADAPAAQNIEMKLVALDRPMCTYSIKLRNGQGEIDFPNKLGKLKVRCQGKTVTVDSNADGKIDERDASAPTRHKLMVTALVGGREVQLPIYLSSMRSSPNGQWLGLGVGGAMEGNFNGSRIRLFWREFSEITASRFYGMEAKAENDNRRPDIQHFAKIVSVANQLYAMEILDSGWKLRFTPYTGPVAQVKLRVSGVAVNDGFVMLKSREGIQNGLVTPAAPAVFVPGRYGIADIGLCARGNDSVFWSMGRGSKDITLSAGENTLAFGGPFKLDFAAIRSGSDIRTTRVDLMGVAGEKYDSGLNNDSGRVFAVFVRGNGKEQELCKLAYG